MFKSLLYTLLISFLWFSLLILIFTFSAYVCYDGLCGGPAAQTVRITAYYQYLGWFTVFYPITVFLCLYFSRLYKISKGEITVEGILLLTIPLFMLIPLIFLNKHVTDIEHSYQTKATINNTPQLDDFICSDQVFIRITTIKGKKAYLTINRSGTTEYNYSKKETLETLKRMNIKESQCISQLGKSF